MNEPNAAEGARPDDADIEVLLVTGLSGAGRSTAAKVLEDIGWYVADNLPPELASRLVDLGQEPQTRIPRLAIVLDVRSRAFSRNLAEIGPGLGQRQIRPRVLFLDASDDVLVRRFEQVRRGHPLQDSGTLSEGIAAERAMLARFRESADLVVDTSSLPVHRLREKIENAFGGESVHLVRVTVQSFGFKYGLPLDADMVADVRFLPNPYWIPELRDHTGQDDDVREYVLGQDGADEYLSTYHRLLQLIEDGYRREGKRYVTIAIGCTGGKHRSVAMSEALADRLRGDADLAVSVVHRDLGRE